MNNEKIYQLNITLLGIDPPVWRTILVSGSTLLPDLHGIIQRTMGWEDAHLHQFMHNKTLYSQSDPWGMVDVTDYSGISISDLLKRKGSKMQYEYDFGDSWRHEILVEKTMKPEPNIQYPVCIDGQNACPPEDCGGIWGYMNVLAAIRDPKNPEYEDLLDWLGEDFDPEAFDKDAVNEALKPWRTS